MGIYSRYTGYCINFCPFDTLDSLPKQVSTTKPKNHLRRAGTRSLYSVQFGTKNQFGEAALWGEASHNHGENPTNSTSTSSA